MNCPFARTPLAPEPSATSTAPLAQPLEKVLPARISERYRSIEDPQLVREILRHAEEFTPANALQAAVDLEPATLRILARGRFALPPVLASASGAGHRAVRKVVAGFFSPAKVAAQREFIAQRTRELCLNLRGRYQRGEELDLASELADVIPPEVMARMTGTPLPPLDQLKAWSKDSLELFWGWPGAQRQQELAHSAVAYHGWLRDSVDEATARDDGNLYSALRHAGVDRDRIVSLAYFLWIAGQETTAMLIHSALFTALRDGHWSGCAAADGGESASERVVHEVLLRASSVPTWRRIALRDITLAGHSFAAGDELLLRLSGGDVAASGDDSLAFGQGLHRCLGAGLARMETGVVVHQAAATLPGIELRDPSPRWRYLVSFQAPEAAITRDRNTGSASA